MVRINNKWYLSLSWFCFFLTYHIFRLGVRAWTIYISLHILLHSLHFLFMIKVLFFIILIMSGLLIFILVAQFMSPVHLFFCGQPTLQCKPCICHPECHCETKCVQQQIMKECNLGVDSHNTLLSHHTQENRTTRIVLIISLLINFVLILILLFRKPIRNCYRKHQQRQRQTKTTQTTSRNSSTDWTLYHCIETTDGTTFSPRWKQTNRFSHNFRSTIIRIAFQHHHHRLEMSFLARGEVLAMTQVITFFCMFWLTCDPRSHFFFSFLFLLDSWCLVKNVIEHIFSFLFWYIYSVLSLH